MRLRTGLTVALASVVAAQPFIIVHTEAAVPSVTARHERRQGFLNSLVSEANSLLGITTTTASSKNGKATQTSASATKTASSASLASSSSTGVLLGPAVTAPFSSTATSTSTSMSTPTSTSTTDSLTSTSTDDSSSTSTDSSASSTTSSASSTSTASSTTPQLGPTNGLGSAQSSSTPDAASSNGGAISSTGIALAVIFPILILAVTAWLIFRYNSRTRAWWLARQERKRQERSYRDGLDGPRQQALAEEGGNRRSMLRSFFTPATVRLGNGQEIRRKPVNWGAESKAVPPMPALGLPVSSNNNDNEKAFMTAAAAPMGQRSPGNSPIDTSPISPVARPITPVGATDQSQLELESISPLSVHLSNRSAAGRIRQKDLPKVPPVPATAVPIVRARRGSDGVFRLA